MANQDALVYSQVKSILSLLSEDYINKIPEKLIEYIDSKASDDSFKIDMKKDIENQELLDKTINIIAFINYRYWSDEEERVELLRLYSENDNSKKASKISVKNDIFTTTNNIESKEMVTYNNKVLDFFQKIINKIKNFFK